MQFIRLPTARYLFPGLPNQIQIRDQIAKPERRRSALPPAQQFSRAAQFQIRLRNLETIRRFLEHTQAFTRLQILRVGHQDAK